MPVSDSGPDPDLDSAAAAADKALIAKNFVSPAMAVLDEKQPVPPVVVCAQSGCCAEVEALPMDSQDALALDFPFWSMTRL